MTNVKDMLHKNLTQMTREYGRHAMFSLFSSLPNPVLCILDREGNRFFDRDHQMYEAALLFIILLVQFGLLSGHLLGNSCPLG